MMTTRSTELDRLDDALVRLRRSLQRPGYRRRLVEQVGLDVPLGTLRVVRAVQRTAPRPPTIGDVAELLAVDPSTASRGVDDAASRGYLERRSCDEDRRRSRLHLTTAGQRLLHRVTDARRHLLGEVITAWSDRELSDLVAVLDRLLDGFDHLEERA